MMKKLTVALLIILIFTIITLFAACSSSSVVGISIYAEPDKTTYIMGEDLDVTGGKISVNYANGKSDIVKITESMVTGFDTSSIGTRSITITYTKSGGSFSTTQEIRTIGVKASTISIATAPVKTSYAVGESITLAGISVDVIYNNGTTGTVGIASLLHEPVIARLGMTTVTVRLDSATAVYNVTVVPKAVSGLSILVPPDKTEYFAGELFDETGLILSVVYNDSTTAQLTEGFTIVNSTISNETESITLRYGDISVECPITVNKAVATGYAVNTIPKTAYTVGETVNFNGLDLSINFNNGQSVTVAYDNNGIYQVNWANIEIISPTGPLIIEDNKITLYYHYGDGANEYLIVEIPIQVSNPTVVGFVVRRNEHLKTEYTDGENINLYGLELDAEYSNGSTVTIINDVALNPDVMYSQTALDGMEYVIIQYSGHSYQYAITVNAE
ncbi:MAG: hypothetical protein EOM87_01320 [Clostridia bacterium]|nr:hypothetical protein [Clostridia bacterium]